MRPSGLKASAPGSPFNTVPLPRHTCSSPSPRSRRCSPTTTKPPPRAAAGTRVPGARSAQPPHGLAGLHCPICRTRRPGSVVRSPASSSRRGTRSHQGLSDPIGHGSAARAQPEQIRGRRCSASRSLLAKESGAAVTGLHDHSLPAPQRTTFRERATEVAANEIVSTISCNQEQNKYEVRRPPERAGAR